MMAKGLSLTQEHKMCMLVFFFAAQKANYMYMYALHCVQYTFNALG